VFAFANTCVPIPWEFARAGSVLGGASPLQADCGFSRLNPFLRLAGGLGCGVGLADEFLVGDSGSHSSGLGPGSG